MGLTRPTARQINTVTTTISDPLTVINAGATGANIDIGLILNRDSGITSNAAIIWQESSDQFVLGLTSNSGAINSNVTISEYANVRAGYFIGDGSQLINIGGSSYSNVQVATYLPTHSGNIGASSVNATDLFGTIRTAAQTNITQVGTLTSGTWNAGIINSTYGGMGVNNGGRTLTVNTNSGTISFTSAATTLTVAAAASVSGTNTGDQTSVSGNAGSATVLQTARNIGGVSFNGSADINLPGVNTTGNQNTTGSAASLTTARAINGVNFNGTADITVPAAAGTLTGATLASGVTASSLTSVGTLSTLIVGNSSGIRLRSVESGGVIYIQAGNGTGGSANTITFAPWTSTTSTMSVDIANQRVGIKKATPTVELDVDGAGAFTGDISGNSIIATTGVFPAADNTGALGNAALTWANGQFTNLTVDGTLSVRAAIDLADNDVLRLGSGDDWEFFHNGTGNYIDLNVGDLIIRDNTTTKITVERTTGSLTTSGVISVNSGNAVTAIINGGSNGVGNIGATATRFNTVFAKATSAQYADLAEIYASDKKYVPGTVLVFGGDKEVTVSTISHDPAIAGVVSTNPAYLMNDSVDGAAVALQGRVPCRVLGPVDKGDRVVASDIRGVAERLDMTKYQPGCIIGKSLDYVPDGEISTIEVVVGRN